MQSNIYIYCKLMRIFANMDYITVGYLCQFLPCRNFHITTKLEGKNCINTVLAAVASTKLKLKHKKK